MDKSSRSSTPSIDVANKRFSADLTKLDELDIAKYGAQLPAQNKKGKYHKFVTQVREYLKHVTGINKHPQHGVE